MIIRPLNDRIAFADQLEISDLDAVKAQGFASIVCNRPDEEGEPHATSDAMAQRAAELQLEFRYLPVNGANITDADADAQAELLDALPAPILTYCRSGARCAKLWALTERGRQDVNTLVEAVDKTGLTIVDIAHRL